MLRKTLHSYLLPALTAAVNTLKTLDTLDTLDTNYSPQRLHYCNIATLQRIKIDALPELQRSLLARHVP